MERWQIALLANGVVAVAYLSISAHVLRGVQRTGAWRTNPLAVATGLIFLTCAAGHAGHMQHVLDPATRPASVMIYDWHLLMIDSVTAVIAIRYWLLRSRFPALVRGAAVFEDLTTRRTEALEIHDQVVQELATAKLALELGDRDRGMAALERGLAASRGIVSTLIGEDRTAGPAAAAGRLRRRTTS